MEDKPDNLILRFTLERCPRCDYLLRGLPEEGQCPECGLKYDNETIVLEGVSREKSQIPRSRVVLWLLIILGFMCWPSLCMVPSSILTGGSPRDISTAISLVVWIVWISLFIYLLLTRKRNRSGMQMYFLSKEGFGLCADLKSGQPINTLLHSWDDVNTFHLKPHSQTWQLLRIGWEWVPGDSRRSRDYLNIGFRCRREGLTFLREYLYNRIERDNVPG